MCQKKNIATQSLSVGGTTDSGADSGKGVEVGDRLSVIPKVRGVEGTRMSASARSMSTTPGVIRKGSMQVSSLFFGGELWSSYAYPPHPSP